MSYDRWLTTNAAAERGEEIEQAIDEYLEKVSYVLAQCPHCLTGRLHIEFPEGLISCDNCDETHNIAETSSAILTQIARNTAFKRIMKERGE